MDESLFKRLLLAGEEDDDIGELIDLGYFQRKEGRILRTRKYHDDTDIFIKEKKERLFRAIEEMGSSEDIYEVMEKAGIEDFITFVFMAEELVQDGILIKDKDRNCVVVKREH